MRSRRFIFVRSADGQRESLPVEPDSTPAEVLEMLRGWAKEAGANEVWFMAGGIEYRMQVDGEPQEGW